MKLLTRDFGEVEVKEEDIFTFDERIYGFEDYSRFIMLYDDEFSGEYVWLQSAEEPGLCFIIANPSLIPDYKPDFMEEAAKTLGNGTFEYWVMMVVRDNIIDSTVNLKRPLIINLETRKGMQLILEQDFPVRYSLFKGKEDE